MLHESGFFLICLNREHRLHLLKQSMSNEEIVIRFHDRRKPLIRYKLDIIFQICNSLLQCTMYLICLETMWNQYYKLLKFGVSVETRKSPAMSRWHNIMPTLQSLVRAIARQKLTSSRNSDDLQWLVREDLSLE